MPKNTEVTDHLVAELFFWSFGWVVCITFLSGAFAVGRWVAAHFGWQVSPDMAGLLSALSVVWLYEHRHYNTRLDRLQAP